MNPGDTIERYTIESVIGEGGMATVYKVRHNQLDNVFALKVLTFSGKQAMRERALNEGRVQATLEHENIVRVFDVLEVNSAPALLMELVDGPSLGDWLEDNRPSLEEAEALFRGILAGMAEAHRQGVVHRDLKPANVMLTDKNGVWLPKVADFGLVKVFDTELTNPTQTGLTMGTPAYMAPEQISDAKNVDARADVFSLGCVLYDLVCGQSAFAGPNVLAIMTKVSAGKYTPPSELVPELPDRIIRAIDGCLKVPLDARLQSCEALAEVLSGGEPTGVLLLPPSRGLVKEPAPPSHRSLLIAGGLAVLLLAAVLTGVVTTLVVRGMGETPDDNPVVIVIEQPPQTADVGPAIGYTPLPCEGRRGKVLGYVQVPATISVSEGASWTLDTARNVRDDYPRKKNDFEPGPVACILAIGDRIDPMQEPIVIEDWGTWLPIEGGSVYLAAPPQEDR